MNINHTLHYSLLDHEVIPKKGSNRICTWLVLNQIIHLSWFTKSRTCTFYQTQFATATTYSPNTVRAALRLLVDKGMIKQIRPYQRATNQAAVYGLTQASIRECKKLYQKHSKAVSPSDRVNNINNIIREDAAKASPPNKKEWTFPSQTNEEPKYKN